MKFTIYTRPVGQMRARATIRGRHATVYKAAKQEQNEQTLAALMVAHRPSTPMDGPVLLYVNAVFACPASKSKKWTNEALRGQIRPTTKPDADNIAKHIKDVMTQLQFWHDDKQVAELVVRKWYGTRDHIDIDVRAAAVSPLGLWEPEDGEAA